MGCIPFCDASLIDSFLHNVLPSAPLGTGVEVMARSHVTVRVLWSLCSGKTYCVGCLESAPFFVRIRIFPFQAIGHEADSPLPVDQILFVQLLCRGQLDWARWPAGLFPH